MRDNVILCGANSYTQKFYIDERFDRLPDAIKDELKIMCVLFVEDVGGVLTLEFDPDGCLNLIVDNDPADYYFDEIGSVLKVKQIQQTKSELLESLELYYRLVILEGAGA